MLSPGGQWRDLCTRQKGQFVQDRNDVCVVMGLQHGWNVRFKVEGSQRCLGDNQGRQWTAVRCCWLSTFPLNPRGASRKKAAAEAQTRGAPPWKTVHSFS